MIRTRHCIPRFITPLYFSQPRLISTRAERMNVTQPFEEERLPWYRADQFYPVRMGETFLSKYKVVGKLGYGAYSTVWLCRDIKLRSRPRTVLNPMLTGATESVGSYPSKSVPDMGMDRFGKTGS